MLRRRMKCFSSFPAPAEKDEMFALGIHYFSFYKDKYIKFILFFWGERLEEASLLCFSVRAIAINTYSGSGFLLTGYS